MSTTPLTVRQAATTAALLGLALTGATAALPGPHAAADPAGSRATAAAARTVTFEVDDCDDCRLRLQEADGAEVWRSPWRVVREGTATFELPAESRQGVSVIVDAPWEGATGYDTTIVFRYAGRDVGDTVGFRAARDARRGTGCWADTSTERAVTIPLVVRRVRVGGVEGQVAGSIAYATTTQGWGLPMQPTPGGVLGSQDVLDCDTGR